jgi:RNA polymerase sigma-70 factor (ECF subfamily)
MNSRVGPNPEELLASARAGDGQALGELLALYTNYLTLLARVQIGRRLRGKVDDVDLVQETFLEAHRHFEGFRGTTEGELVSWLRQILAANLSNLLRRYFGTRGRDVRLERELADELDQSSQALGQGLAASQSSPSQQAVRREQAVLLADALERLPEAYREVIILSHLEGLRFPEIARRMGRTVDSVKNLWARALGRLRRSLGERHE